MVGKFKAVLAVVLIGGGVALSPVVNAATTNPLTDQELAKKECSDCHFFYDRQFLPAFSWKRIIDNLDDHFGDDATVDEPIRTRILSYMAGGRSTDIPMRITKSRWWLQAHGANFEAFAAKSNVKVGNCGACHRQ